MFEALFDSNYQYTILQKYYESDSSLNRFNNLIDLLTFKEEIKKPKIKKGIDPSTIILPQENESYITLRFQSIKILYLVMELSKLKIDMTSIKTLDYSLPISVNANDELSFFMSLSKNSKVYMNICQVIKSSYYLIKLDDKKIRYNGLQQAIWSLNVLEILIQFNPIVLIDYLINLIFYVNDKGANVDIQVDITSQYTSQHIIQILTDLLSEKALKFHCLRVFSILLRDETFISRSISINDSLFTQNVIDGLVSVIKLSSKEFVSQSAEAAVDIEAEKQPPVSPSAQKKTPTSTKNNKKIVDLSPPVIVYRDEDLIPFDNQRLNVVYVKLCIEIFIKLTDYQPSRSLLSNDVYLDICLAVKTVFDCTKYWIVVNTDESILGNKSSSVDGNEPSTMSLVPPITLNTATLPKKSTNIEISNLVELSVRLIGTIGSLNNDLRRQLCLKGMLISLFQVLKVSEGIFSTSVDKLASLSNISSNLAPQVPSNRGSARGPSTSRTSSVTKAPLNEVVMIDSSNELNDEEKEKFNKKLLKIRILLEKAIMIYLVVNSSDNMSNSDGISKNYVIDDELFQLTVEKSEEVNQTTELNPHIATKPEKTKNQDKQLQLQLQLQLQQLQSISSNVIPILIIFELLSSFDSDLSHRMCRIFSVIIQHTKTSPSESFNNSYECKSFMKQLPYETITLLLHQSPIIIITNLFYSRITDLLKLIENKTSTVSKSQHMSLNNEEMKDNEELSMKKEEDESMNELEVSNNIVIDTSTIVLHPLIEEYLQNCQNQEETANFLVSSLTPSLYETIYHIIVILNQLLLFLPENINIFTGLVAPTTVLTPTGKNKDKFVPPVIGAAPINAMDRIMMIIDILSLSGPNCNQINNTEVKIPNFILHTSCVGKISTVFY